MGSVHAVSHHYKVDRPLKFVYDALESGMKSKQDEESLVEEQCSRISNGPLSICKCNILVFG